MKFRTKKNQTNHEYDEYLAYEEAEQALPAEPLYEEAYDQYQQMEDPLYDSPTQYEDFSPNDTERHQLESPLYMQHEESDDIEAKADHDSLEDEVYPSRQAYLQNKRSSEFENTVIPEGFEIDQESGKLRRAKYSAKVDRFLTNGIIVVGVLLIAVLLIAFLV